MNWHSIMIHLQNVDDESCISIVNGCTDNAYVEFNPANVDDESCNILIVLSCDDATALNYDSLANTNNGSCIDIVIGCTDRVLLIMILVLM